MNISCGMRAAEGAIEDVKITEHGVEFTCIDGKNRWVSAEVEFWQC